MAGRNVPAQTTQSQASQEALLEKLFRWKRTVEYNGVTFYIRIVSDATIDDGRKYALLQSRKLRRDLRDMSSDAFLMYLDPFVDYNDEELTATIITAAARPFIREYFTNTIRPVIEPPAEGATQEQLEQYEEAKEQRDAAYVKEMDAAVKQWRADFDTMLKQRSHDDLLRMAFRYETDVRCENVYTQEFEDYIVSASVYKDASYKERMFTLEEYKNLPTEIKRLLYTTYNDMSLGAEDIKNS